MTRDVLMEALRSAVGTAPWIRAAWVGGSDATHRTDAWSDIDLQLVTSPSRWEDAFVLIEGCLDGLGGIAHRVDFGERERGAYCQRFYRAVGAPEHLMVDLCVMHPERLGPHLDPDRHGDSVIWHDADGLLTPRADRGVAHAMMVRHADLEAKTPMFAHLAAKALRRGLLIEAHTMYRRVLLSPLVEALRMRHCPVRWDFGFRYLPDDLPPDVVERLERLSFPVGAEGLASCIAEARAWLEAELAEPLGDGSVDGSVDGIRPPG